MVPRRASLSLVDNATIYTRAFPDCDDFKLYSTKILLYCVPDVFEPADADGNVVLVVLQVVERLNGGAVPRRPDGPDRLTEPDVRGHRLQQSVVRSDLARIQHERLAEEVLVAISEQSDLLAGGGRRQRRRIGHAGLPVVCVITPSTRQLEDVSIRNWPIDAYTVQNNADRRTEWHLATAGHRPAARPSDGGRYVSFAYRRRCYGRCLFKLDVNWTVGTDRPLS